MQKQRSKIVKIYNKWEFIAGLIVLFGISYILLLFHKLRKVFREYKKAVK